MNPLVSKSHLSVMLGVTPRTVQRWMSANVITYIRVGNTVRFDMEAVRSDLKRFKIRTSLAGASSTLPIESSTP